MAIFKSDLNVTGKVIADDVVIDGMSIVSKLNDIALTEDETHLDIPAKETIVLDKDLRFVCFDLVEIDTVVFQIKNNSGEACDYFILINDVPTAVHGCCVGSNVANMHNKNGMFATLDNTDSGVFEIDASKRVGNDVLLTFSFTTENKYYSYKTVVCDVDKHIAVKLYATCDCGFSANSELVVEGRVLDE